MSRKPELNGNGTFLGKRKKTRSKKLPSKSNFNNLINSSGDLYEHCNGGLTPTYSPYWSPMIPNQRLYPAVSDPSVCNYPIGIPVRYRVEPTMSLPVYPMCQQPQSWQNGSNSNIHNHIRNKPKPATSTDSVYSSSKNNDSLHNQEFTSLPPVIDRLILEDSDNKRRFSDPGIGPAIDESDGSSGRSSVLTVDNNKDNSLLYSFIEQVNALKETNRTLFKELHETKSELSALKQQVSAWSRRDREYEPGSVAEIIREIRDAAKVREDALITKVRHMIEEKTFNRPFFPPSFNNSREIEDLRSQLKDALSDNNRKQDRVMKLEEEIRNLKLNSSRIEDINSNSNATNTAISTTTNKLVDDDRKNETSIFGMLRNMFLAVTDTNIVQGTPDNEDVTSLGPVTSQTSGGDTDESLISYNPSLLQFDSKDVFNSTLADPTSLESELLNDVQGTTQVLELEQETLQLRRELQEAVDGRKEAEARNIKYERQIQLQHRRRSSSNETNIINNSNSSVSGNSSGHTPIINSTNPFENNSSLLNENDMNKMDSSLMEQQHTTSNISYEHTSPLHVTLSGPVTDL